MNDQTLYYSYDDKNYRFKIADQTVYIERHCSFSYKALSQESYPFEVFPVKDDRYWAVEELNRLIAWYEADLGDGGPAVIECNEIESDAS